MLKFCSRLHPLFLAILSSGTLAFAADGFELRDTLLAVRMSAQSHVFYYETLKQMYLSGDPEVKERLNDYKKIFRSTPNAAQTSTSQLDLDSNATEPPKQHDAKKTFGVRNTKHFEEIYHANLALTDKAYWQTIELLTAKLITFVPNQNLDLFLRTQGLRPDKKRGTPSLSSRRSS